MIVGRREAWAVGGTGDPLVPPSVLAEVQAIHPRLGLRYDRSLRCFLVTYQWGEDDPRRAMIQRGEIEPWSDWEILAPVPADVSLDELRGWIAMQLRKVGKHRSDVQRMIEDEEARIKAADEAAEAARSAEAIETMLTASTKNINVGSRRTKVKL